MTNYQNAVIYVIYVGEQKYVGSTCDFKARKRQHKTLINNPHIKGSNLKVYKAIRENGGEWRMEINKQFPCDSKQELQLEEERIRKELGAELNTNCCGTGLTEVEYKKQHYQDNKDKVLEKEKERYLENREMKLEYQKQYYEQNKEKVVNYNKQYRENNKEKLSEQQKQYREKNHEKSVDYNKQYREENKEKIREQKVEKIECPICGFMSTRSNMKRHQRTAKCQRIAEQRAEEVGAS